MNLKNKWRGLLLLGSVFMAVNHATVAALPYGAGTYGTCQYSSCGITVTTGGTVTLPVTPTTTGVYTTASDNVTVSTNSSTGYTLTFKDSDTNTNLTNGGNSISAHSGTPASPTTLAMNSWGYRVDGLSGFGAGPTSAQSNQSSSSYTFAGVPASNQTAHTLRTSTTAANPSHLIKVWYGVRANTSLPNGTYTDQVTYTAVTND